MQSLPPDIEAWLKAFSRAVRERDFASGKKLFDPAVLSFGTVCFRVEGLDQLADGQWQAVWPNTRDFDFEYPSARALPDASQATVLATWSSTGLDSAGEKFQRRGRATIVLRRAGSGWKAVHTHFSIAPSHEHDPLPRQGT